MKKKPAKYIEVPGIIEGVKFYDAEGCPQFELTIRIYRDEKYYKKMEKAQFHLEQEVELKIKQ